MSTDSCETDGTLSEVAVGVWAWIQGDGSWWINNAGVIAGDDGDVLVDTCATESRTRNFLDCVRAVRPGSPIRFAVNTHLHGDHTNGNSLLADTTCVVGHSNMRVELAQNTIIDQCPPYWSPTPSWGNVRKRLPALTYDDRLVLHSATREIHVIHPGYAAHTGGDSVVLVPDAGALFVGDLLFHQVTPLFFMGSLDGALRSLDWIAQFDPEVVVPGHGEVIGREALDMILQTHRSYYELIHVAAVEGIRADISPLDAAKRIELGAFAEMPDAERVVLNMHRAYAEVSGHAFDMTAAFEDAVLYHEGLLPTCV